MALKKNKGPILTSTKQGDRNVIPPDLLAAVEIVETKQPVPNDVDIAEIGTAGVVESELKGDRTDENERFIATAELPVTLTGKIVTKENGGAVLTRTRTLQAAGGTPTSGTLVQASSILPTGNGTYVLDTDVNPASEWPVRYGTHTEPSNGIVVDISRQAVDANTLGGLITPSALAIASIQTGSPGILTFATPHYFWPGDTVTIAGVTGGTTISGDRVVTPLSSLSVSIPVNILSAGTGGTATNVNTQQIYVDVEPVDFISVRTCSRLRVSSVLGTDGGTTYPVTIQYKKATVVTNHANTSEFVNGTLDDIGINYDTAPGEQGEFKGLVTEYYMTQNQLAAWYSEANYPTMTMFVPGGESAEAYGSNTGTRGKVWTFHRPLSDDIVEGAAGPNGGFYFSVKAESLSLGLFVLRVFEIFDLA